MIKFLLRFVFRGCNLIIFSFSKELKKSFRVRPKHLIYSVVLCLVTWQSKTFLRITFGKLLAYMHKSRHVLVFLCGPRVYIRRQEKRDALGQPNCFDCWLQKRQTSKLSSFDNFHKLVRTNPQNGVHPKNWWLHCIYITWGLLLLTSVQKETHIYIN